MKSDALDKIHELANLISRCSKLTDYKTVRGIRNELEIVVSAEDVSHLKRYGKESGFSFDDGLDSIIIDMDSILSQMYVFFSVEEFEGKCREKYNDRDDLTLSSFAVVGIDGDYAVVENDRFIAESGQIVNKVLGIELFYIFAHKLRSISNYVDETTHEYVIFTSNKGVMKMALGERRFDKNNDCHKLQSSIERFNIVASDKIKLDFIRSSIIDNIESAERRDVAAILSRLDNILDDAERNHQLYLEQFSFEKFKTSWDKEKEKYFNDFRGLITKITAQMANLPIALIAFVLTSNGKLTNIAIEKMFFLIFSVYVFSTLWIQVTNISEVVDLHRKIRSELGRISCKYPSTYGNIEQEGRELKCKSINLLLLSLIVILAYGYVSLSVIYHCIMNKYYIW